jgi:5-formyltetrahydrofolate cyclo-ligase
MYPWTVGLALREQILPESDIPMEGSDQRLNAIMYAEEL